MSTRNTAAAPAAAAGQDGARLLRASLRVDGWGTAAFGVVMLAGGGWLSGPLGLPATWFVPIGIVMLAGGVALGLIARRPRVQSGAAVAAITANVLSGAVILPLAVAGVLPLTNQGTAFMVVGALWVLTFAALTAVGLRRATAASR